MSIITNRDYLTKTLAKFDVSSDDVDIILCDNPQLNGSAVVNSKDCKLAIYKSLSTILPVASVSESDYSKTWNIEALKLWYKSLCSELGKANALKPAIRDRSNYH
jgi:hypothetical protein